MASNAPVTHATADRAARLPTTPLSPCAPLVLGDEWARGAFGSVFVVDAPHYHGTARKIAVKRVPDPIGHVNRELETCVRLARDPHPNIVQMLGYWTEEGAEGAAPEAPQAPQAPHAHTNATLGQTGAEDQDHDDCSESASGVSGTKRRRLL